MFLNSNQTTIIFMEVNKFVSALVCLKGEYVWKYQLPGTVRFVKASLYQLGHLNISISNDITHYLWDVITYPYLSV